MYFQYVLYDAFVKPNVCVYQINDADTRGKTASKGEVPPRSAAISIKNKKAQRIGSGVDFYVGLVLSKYRSVPEETEFDVSITFIMDVF